MHIWQCTVSRTQSYACLCSISSRCSCVEGRTQRLGRLGCARWVQRATATAQWQPDVQPAPGEGVYSGLAVPKAGKVPRGETRRPQGWQSTSGETMGEHEEETQEVPMKPAQGGHCTWEEGEGSAMRVVHACPCSAPPFCMLCSPGGGWDHGLVAVC